MWELHYPQNTWQSLDSKTYYDANTQTLKRMGLWHSFIFIWECPLCLYPYLSGCSQSFLMALMSHFWTRRGANDLDLSSSHRISVKSLHCLSFNKINELRRTLNPAWLPQGFVAYISTGRGGFRLQTPPKMEQSSEVKKQEKNWEIGQGEQRERKTKSRGGVERHVKMSRWLLDLWQYQEKELLERDRDVGERPMVSLTMTVYLDLYFNFALFLPDMPDPFYSFPLGLHQKVLRGKFSNLSVPALGQCCLTGICPWGLGIFGGVLWGNYFDHILSISHWLYSSSFLLKSLFTRVCFVSL